MVITTNYKKLKLCKHGLPTWDAMLPIVLLVASEHAEPIKRSMIKDEVIKKMGLPKSLQQLKSDRDESIIYSRIGWPISELAVGGLLDRPKRGVYQITDLGKQLLAEQGSALTSEMIHQQPQYIQHQNELAQKGNDDFSQSIDTASDDTDSNPLLLVGPAVKKHNDSVSIELLDRIRKGTPYFFEKLVVELLSNMGYKGENGQAMVTQKSNDKGIDGIINQDALGTSTVYLQAKKYQATNKVGRKEMHSFVGALSDFGSDRGVFITTSDFTGGAIEYAKNQHIVLINGVRLSDLMLQYQVGVNVKKQYTTFDIDEDFFIEDD